MNIFRKHKIVTATVLSAIIGSSVGLSVIAQNKDVPSEPVNQIIQTPAKVEVGEKAVEKTNTEEVKKVEETTAPVVNNDEPKPEEPKEEKSYNPYIKGTPTYYTYEQRQKDGLVVGNWGGGDLWAYSAYQAGVAVDDKPEVGATLQDKTVVGVITSIKDGIVTYKTMMNNELVVRKIPTNRAESGQVRIIH